MRSLADHFTLLLLLLLLHCLVSPTHAESVEYTIDPAQSSINLVPATFSGFEVTAGTHIATSSGLVESEPGSLTTSIAGNIFGDLAAGALQISGNSNISLAANPLGPFAPSTASTGSAGQVDNFGGFLALSPSELIDEVAIRDVTATVQSGALSIGSAPQSLTIELVTGLADIKEIGQSEGDSESVPGLTDPAINSSSLLVTGDFASTITVPIRLLYSFGIFDDNDSLIELEGTVVAHRVDPPLVGDYNGDTVVDAVDYAVWRNTLGQQGTNLAADGNGDDEITQADYTLWRINFGNSTSGAAVAAPEPGTFACCCMALLAMLCHRRWTSLH